MVPSFSPLTYIPTGIQWQIYSKDLNPDKPLNGKNMLSMILFDTQPNTTSGLDSIQTISCLDSILDHFLSRQPPATSCLDIAGNPKWICSPCTNLHSPIASPKKQKRISLWFRQSSSQHVPLHSDVFPLPFQVIISDQPVHHSSYQSFSTAQHQHSA